MHLLRQNRSDRRFGALAALLIAGALLLGGAHGVGSALDAQQAALLDPTTGFHAWTWLPGQRALWLSKQPACVPDVIARTCGDHASAVRAMVQVVYFGSPVRRLTVPLPRPVRRHRSST